MEYQIVNQDNKRSYIIVTVGNSQVKITKDIGDWFTVEKLNPEVTSYNDYIFLRSVPATSFNEAIEKVKELQEKFSL
jgi:hypothetical protein